MDTAMRASYREACLRRSQILLVAGAAVAAIVASVTVDFRDEASGWMYTLVLALVACVGVAGFRVFDSAEGRRNAWMHAPVLFTAYYVVMIGVPGLLAFVYPRILTEVETIVGYSPVFMARGAGLTAAGILALWMGYLLGWKTVRPFAAAARVGRMAPTPRIVIAFYAVSVLVRLTRILVTGIDHGSTLTTSGDGLELVGQWIFFLESMRYLILAILSIGVFAHGWAQRPLLAVLLMELMFCFTSGTFKPMLWVVVVVGASALCSGVRLRRSYKWYFVVLGIASVAVVPIGQGLRLGMAVFDARSPMDVARAAWTVAQLTWGAGLDVGWEMFLAKVPGRMAGVAYMPGLIMWKTPSQIPYLGVEGFLQIPAYMIPRILWPDKPVLTQGYWLSVNYLNLPPTTQSKSAFTLFGEAYIFTGWWGVILASLALGYLLSVLHKNTWSVGLLAVYVALIPSFIDMEGQLTTSVVGLIQAGVVFTLIYRVMCALSSPRRAGYPDGFAPPGRALAVVPAD
jgi:hypothetical protein